MELWVPCVFTKIGNCLCCKGEVNKEETGFKSHQTKKDISESYLCNECQVEWRKVEGRLCDISRFKLE